MEEWQYWHGIGNFLPTAREQASSALTFRPYFSTFYVVFFRPKSHAQAP
jgi:hypothetical protein